MSDKRNKLKRSRISSEESDSSSVSSSTSSSDAETDAKDLKPIKEYLSNRKELASQLFKSVKGEKIRMMLPQILKKVDLNELEELCTNELIGMSKARILSIINGKEMAQSSNTEDSDDRDPSLEIISDTEWISDEPKSIKTDSKNSKNKIIKGDKKRCQDQTKQDLKPKLKSKGKGKLNVKIKSELKETEKQKEGESLLDLLELEMRARAIRALIRKEEDFTNPKNDQTNDLTNTVSALETSNDKNTKARQENLKEQLEKIDVLMKHGEDEDVFVVIQQAPTIELLSSESDTDDHSKRVNQKLVNERISKSEKVSQEEQSGKSKNKDVYKEKDKNSEKKYINIDKEKNEGKNKDENSKERENRNKNSNLLVAESNVNVKVEKSSKLLKEVDLEDGEIIDDNDNDKGVNEEIKATDESLFNRKFKKIKRNPFIRSRKKNKENNDDNIECTKVGILEKQETTAEDEKNIKKNEKTVVSELIEIKESPKRKNNTEEILKIQKSESNISSKIDLYDDKSLDIDEVINLDDYPDDMDDLEISDNKERENDNKITHIISKDTDKNKTNNFTSRSETWATRYYRQDDVQNVIKESKIQSEIRKRLRERQRQSKMNNSPKLKGQEVLQQNSEPIIPKPTGSVEEYLALKGLPSEMNSSTSVIVESSKLLKENDSFVDGNDFCITNDNLSSREDKIVQNNLFMNDNKSIEQPIIIVKKAKLVGDVATNKNSDSILNENITVKQLNKIINFNDLLVDNSEASFQQKRNDNNLLKNLEENSSKTLEQNESNALRNNETSRNSNSNNDKDSVIIQSIDLSNKKLFQESNDQQINEQVDTIILNESKTSELRPD